MDFNEKPVDPSVPSADTAPASARDRRTPIVYAMALLIALVLIIGVLSIQMKEFLFYRAPQSVWPAAIIPSVAAVKPEPSTPTPVKTDSKPVEVPAASVPAIENPASFTPITETKAVNAETNK